MPLTVAPAKNKKIRSASRGSSPAVAPASFPIAGIGASAGGLEAFTELLKHLPPDTGMGFVLVQHLAPQHESALAQLLSRATPMLVREVTDNLRVEPNCVYVIPPNSNLIIKQGRLKLQTRQQARPPTRSIDSFFESLAQDQRERAIGVILSGTATDGTLGLEAIKAEGGITFAQDDSAKYDSMPGSAVAAGCVDFVLKPENIAKELTRIARHPYLTAPVSPPPRGAPAEGDLHSCAPTAEPTAEKAQPLRGAPRPALSGAQNGYQQILVLLRNHSGVDFSLYKPTTIHRRIMRGVVLKKQETIERYAAFLRANPEELDALYSDLLISVTSFFRNPEAFEVLQNKVFPKLLRQREELPLRVWVLGCSTGQEAYSIAMSYTEAAEKVFRVRKLQVFATDLNDTLLDKARSGLYGRNLVQDVSPERLRRFFVKEEGGYRVVGSLRESVIFARQNLIGDPPFSRMDLISCRNLMIYLEPALQRKALPTFHYALNPGGILFLGASESIDGFTDLFEQVDKKQKIFIKKPAPASLSQLPLKGVHGAHAARSRFPKLGLPLPIENAPGEATNDVRGELNALREADRVTVNRFAPPGVLVNAELQIVQFRGATGAYLQTPSAGRAGFDLLKMARAGLMLPLRSMIAKAKKANKPVRKENVVLGENGKTRLVSIEVAPLRNLKERYFLILFENVSNGRAQPGESTRGGAAKSQRAVLRKEASRDYAELKRELSETRQYLQSIQEQHEAANEELQSSNEELQSANEELQSINEELETSKEELESTNEELTTANEEVSRRNTELGRLNADLINLQTATNLAIVLLGRDLSVRRFSPRAERKFGLLAADVGRHITEIRHNLNVPNLESLLGEVVAKVRDLELDVRDNDGHWFSLRLRPYLTAENKVDGAVMVLVDIDALKWAEERANEAHLYAQAVVDGAPPLLVLDENLRVQSTNQRFCEHFQVSPAKTHNALVYELGNGQWNIPQLRTLLEDVLPRDRDFKDFEIVHDFETIGRRTMILSGRRLDHLQQILLFIDDITERVRLEGEMRASELRYRRLFETTKEGLLLLDSDTGRITDANPFIAEMLGYAREELAGKELWEIGLLKDEQESKAAFQNMKGSGTRRYDDISLKTKDGRTVHVEVIGTLYSEDDKTVVQCNIHDISERKQNEEALRMAKDALANEAVYLERLVDERTADLSASNEQLETFVYSMAHDLRAPLRAMQGFATMLKDDHETRLSETGQDYVERIDKSAQFMDSLLIDLLAFSRTSLHHLELTPVHFGRVVESVLSRLQSQIQELDARLEIPDTWPTVLAHEPTLMQILFNLVSNALKFGRQGVPPLLRLRAEERAAFIRVWVEDNGVGIAPEYQDQVFRLFTRLHGEKYQGTGIGLAIVQKGIERMGGRVGVESTVGEGSRFWLELQKASTPG